MATRLPSLSVQNGAWSRSRVKPETRKWRSSTIANRTPARARGLPHALREPQPARRHAEPPRDRLAHPLDLLEAVFPEQRNEDGLVEPREQQLHAPFAREPADQVEQSPFVRFEPLEQRTGEMDGNGEKLPLRQPLEKRPVHVAHVLLEHVIEISNRLVEVDPEGKSDRLQLSPPRRRGPGRPSPVQVTTGAGGGVA